MNWVERATDLLHDGERIREEIRVGAGGVVMTNRRLLVFTPNSGGSNYQQVDLPNVEGIDLGTSGDSRFLGWGLKAGFVGSILVAFGFAFDLDEFGGQLSLDAGGTAGASGLGGILSVVQTAFDLLPLVDDTLRITGGLALAVTAVALGAYVWSRDQWVVISLAGGDDVRVAAPENESVIEELRRAILPEQAAGSAAGRRTAAGSATRSENSDPLGSDPTGSDGKVGTTTDAERGEPLEHDPFSNDPDDASAGIGDVLDPDGESTIEDRSDEEVRK